MPKVNGVEPSKINGITLPSSLLTGSWAARPGTGDDSLSFDDPSHGDWYRVSSSADGWKANYRYSTTIEEWVRPEVFQGNPAVKARIQGSILPSAESPAWTHTTANAGTITTDDTKVTFEADAANNDTAYVKYTHGQSNSEHHFFQGLVQSIGNQAIAGNHKGRSIMIDVSTPAGHGSEKRFMVTLNTNANTASLARVGGYAWSSRRGSPDWTLAGHQLQWQEDVADATTAEVYLEMYTSLSGAWVYIDNNSTPMAVTTWPLADNSDSTTSGSYIIGDWDSSEQGKMTMREAFFGTFEPTANTASIFNQYGGT